MRRCVIWGAGQDYENIINQIKYEELKGNLECVAILSKTTSQFAKKLDGYNVIGKEELKNIKFDYLIISIEKDDTYKKILEEALAMDIPRQKIVHGRVFKIPNFDFARYASLRENPVTILSDDCWGGYVYHYLDLPFTSPLINIYWPRDSYCKFIQDPIFYLEQPLLMEQDGDAEKELTPVGRLGTGDRSVYLNFVHEPNFQTAEKNWTKRKMRMNKDRIFVKFGFDATATQWKEFLTAFDNIPYPKICTYSGETDMKNVFYTERFSWEWNHLNGKRLDLAHFCDWFRAYYTKVIDVLSLLNDDEEYIREK